MAPTPQRNAPEVVELPPEPAAIETLRAGNVRQELRQAAHMLQGCGLAHSAAWAAEQLRGLRQEEDDDGDAPVTASEPQASDALLLAKAYFDAKVRYGARVMVVTSRFDAAACRALDAHNRSKVNVAHRSIGERPTHCGRCRATRRCSCGVTRYTWQENSAKSELRTCAYRGHLFYCGMWFGQHGLLHVAPL
jgi:Anaphase promoting complex subunit 8 / Cdc23